MKFYKDHYEVVIIGGALAGMSACLQLQAWGFKDILILEKHNMPGGLATDDDHLIMVLVEFHTVILSKKQGA